ncbi:protection of telomeres protein 1-like [Lingula anatina]|uniref:Protection of telomeres protein 1 n=1 Tax=Lingula anatina TaxID=7574 RepID=A0A1S3I9A4_LINAN|nr:protection of telomeres protein 1-like [Lingula anatina]|eukprot:XP_013394446.1 protection of telomeres protein 1-like [Lingula anatina]
MYSCVLWFQVGETNRKYTYVPLSKLTRGATVDVYAVVKFFKPPTKTRGSDYYMVLSLVDPSLADKEKIKCILFAKSATDLPPVQTEGEIVRMHRLKIGTFNGELQGQNGPGFSCIVFSADLEDPIEPKSTTRGYTLTDQDRLKVEELREWSLQGECFSQERDNRCTLGECVVGQYFDLLCQVVGIGEIEVEVGRCVLLQVWDGTEMSSPYHKCDIAKEDIHIDEQLTERVLDFIVDVYVFDDHVPVAQKLKPGQFIMLKNLHAAMYKDEDTRPELSAVPTIELCLHKGTSYGRGIMVMAEGSGLKEEVTCLKDIMNGVCLQLQDEGAPGSPNNPQPSTSTGKSTSPGKMGETANKNSNSMFSRNVILPSSPQPSTSRGVSKSPRKSRDTADQRSSRSEHSIGHSMEPRVENVVIIDESESLDLNSSPSGKDTVGGAQAGGASYSPRKTPHQARKVDRCLLKTASVINGHHHLAISTIQEVLHHSVPHTFRVLAQVLDYQPKQTPYIRLTCPMCHYLAVPDSKWLTEHVPSRVQDKVPYYPCPQCDQRSVSAATSSEWSVTRVTSAGTEVTSTDGQMVVSGQELEYVYMMEFLLEDGTGWLVARIWKQHAVTFLNDISPETLIWQEDGVRFVEGQLKELSPTPGRSEQKPWLECCLLSYNGPDGERLYHIFDTTLALECL